MFDLNNLVRKNIKSLKRYSSARDEYKGKKGIFLDANENAFGAPVEGVSGVQLNRYPDPIQVDLKEKLSRVKGVPMQNIFLGNGSDEAIDILFRAFCVPGTDNVIVCPPTYGMYEVSAAINDVLVKKVPLIAETFQLDTPSILKAVDAQTKLIFVCSPNNPTGNGISVQAIKKLLENFNGIVVVDEAYINFAGYRSLIPELLSYPNLVILQTFSKAWGLAGLRIGMAFASEPIVDVLNSIKPPYNINVLSQQLALKALENIQQVNEWTKLVVKERQKLKEALSSLPFVTRVYPSEANFLLVKTSNTDLLYNYLIQQQVIVRNRSNVVLCEGCIRITVGTEKENEQLLLILKQYAK